MLISFRKFATALVAGAIGLTGANAAQAGILLTISDGGSVIDTENLAGNFVNSTVITGANGYSFIQVQGVSNAPGTASSAGGLGTLNLVLTATSNNTPAGGTAPTLVVTATVVNDGTTTPTVFTIPSSTTLSLNTDLTANGNITGTAGTAALLGTAVGQGSGATTATSSVSTLVPSNLEVTGSSPFSGVSGYTLSNQVTLSGLNNGAVLVSVTGKTAVIGPAAVPEPGTMAAALTGLLFVGGLGLRRRQK